METGATLELVLAEGLLETVLEIQAVLIVGHTGMHEAASQRWILAGLVQVLPSGRCNHPEACPGSAGAYGLCLDQALENELADQLVLGAGGGVANLREDVVQWFELVQGHVIEEPAFSLAENAVRRTYLPSPQSILAALGDPLLQGCLHLGQFVESTRPCEGN